MARLLLQSWEFWAALHFPRVHLFLPELAAHVAFIIGESVL